MDTHSPFDHHHHLADHHSEDSLLVSSAHNETSRVRRALLKTILPHKSMNGTLKSKQLGCINSLAFNTEIAAGVQETQAQLSPYLYPCIIEYSLMCMTVFYILWSSIEQRYNKNNHFGTWGGGFASTEMNNLEQDEQNKNSLARESGTNELRRSQIMTSNSTTASELNRMQHGSLRRSDEMLSHNNSNNYNGNHQKRNVHQFIVGKSIF
jgi:hypothetical protein